MLEISTVVPEENKYIDTRICRIERIGEGFATFYFKGNDDSVIEEFEELIDMCMELMENKPFVVITDLRNNYGSFSQEVKEYLASHEDLKKNKIAEALVVNSLGIRLQVNFFIKFLKSDKMIMKVFTDEKKALEWVLQKKKELL